MSIKNIFIWRVDESGKYQIAFGQNQNSKSVVFNVTEFIPNILGINRKEFESFIRDNGAYKHLDGKFYFKSKEQVQSVIEQLNTMRKLSSRRKT